MRRTKIIATLGPATSALGTLAGLLRAGVDVARLNMSHADHQVHARAIAEVRRVAAAQGRPVALLADLQGSKARVGRLADGGPLPLRRGDLLTLTPRRVIGRPGLVPTSHRHLGRDVRPGDPILLDDGRIELVVLRRQGADVVCRVVTGGLLLENKGMNLPGADPDAGPLTAKDLADLDFAIRHEVDYVALSFVRSGEDVERVPVLQKRILQEANREGVIAITATQMLESMVEHPRPTRAEASDVANAIFDGTDAVMLSAETASGKYPVRVVRVMDRIIREAEKSGLQWPMHADLRSRGRSGEVHAVAHAAVDAAREWGAVAVVIYTQTGETARVLSKLRPPCPIIALAPTEQARRRMALYWGVLPLAMRFSPGTDRMLRDGQRVLLAARLLKKGDRVIVVSGTSPRAGATNLMKLHRLGEGH